MRPIEPLLEEEEDEEDLLGDFEDRAPREIGEYIRHEDFNPEALAQEAEETVQLYNNLSELE